MLRFKLFREGFLNGIQSKIGWNIAPEAALGYFNRLPDRISVRWFRDGEFIIGDVIAGDAAFKTQAKSPVEFVDMVNDAVFASYEIPTRYFEYLSGKRFRPDPIAFAELNDGLIQESNLNLYRQKVAA